MTMYEFIKNHEDIEEYKCVVELTDMIMEADDITKPKNYSIITSILLISTSYLNSLEKMIKEFIKNNPEEVKNRLLVGWTVEKDLNEHVENIHALIECLRGDYYYYLDKPGKHWKWILDIIWYLKQPIKTLS